MHDEAQARRLAAALDLMPLPRPEALDALTVLDLVTSPDALTVLDLMTSPDGRRIEPADRVAEIHARYPESSPVFRAVSRSGEALVEAAGRTRARLGLPDPWPSGH